VDDLLTAAQAAMKKGQPDEALSLARKAIVLEPKNPRPYLVRGTFREALGFHAPAVADFDKVIELDPKLAAAYDHRGSEHFKLGNFTQSLADFDRFLQLRPDAGPAHWKRGITCYYAGKFDEGRKQFEAGRDVYKDDVENAAWHFLCAAKVSGIDKARLSLLEIGKDRRVPLMEVYALYAGKAKPEDVLAAARAGKPAADELNERLFYALLYVGLYEDAAGDRERALEHLKKAVEDYKIDHYMWDVARIHLELLREAKPK
jgi:lipoprotein NlpI